MNRPHCISFFACGTPKGQPRPRAFIRGKRAAVYDPGTAEGWKGQIAIAWRETGLDGAAEAQAYHVALVFRFPRPKHHFTGKGSLKPASPVWHTAKPDADNAAKAVLDALTALSVWRDDAQVACLTIDKRYGDKPGCQITIQALQ